MLYEVITYEDTGKLTYSRTTPRDVRASAFLLEQGASLQIIVITSYSIHYTKLYDEDSQQESLKKIYFEIDADQKNLQLVLDKLNKAFSWLCIQE